jgi:hypothetical protein
MTTNDHGTNRDSERLGRERVLARTKICGGVPNPPERSFEGHDLEIAWVEDEQELRTPVFLFGYMASPG